MDDSELHSIKEAKIFACTVQIFCVDGSRMAVCSQVYVHKFFPCNCQWEEEVKN